ncbi:MAG: rhomboid family intramembrane serine protease [Chitinophagaceae bacterium]|nr:rhomboid family intramembrane serine protease [Chitinophagaceae bacterium]
MAFAQFVLGNMGIDLTDYLGLHYWKSHYFYAWQFVTHMFMHGSIGHIFLNMFALWMFGSVLENVWGPKRFLTFYLICGVGAALLHLGVFAFEFESMAKAFDALQNNPTQAQLQTFQDVVNKWSGSLYDFSRAPMNAIYQELYGGSLSTGQYMAGIVDQTSIGASGAVFGLLFAFGYLFPNTLLYIYFLVPVKAKYVVAGFAVLQLIEGLSNSVGDNVAHFAHLGGMLVGFIVLKIWNKSNRNTLY